MSEQYAASSHCNVNKRDHRNMGSRNYKHGHSRNSYLYIYPCGRSVCHNGDS